MTEPSRPSASSTPAAILFPRNVEAARGETSMRSGQQLSTQGLLFEAPSPNNDNRPLKAIGILNHGRHHILLGVEAARGGGKYASWAIAFHPGTP